MSWIEFEGVCV